MDNYLFKKAKIPLDISNKLLYPIDNIKNDSYLNVILMIFITSDQYSEMFDEIQKSTKNKFLKQVGLMIANYRKNYLTSKNDHTVLKQNVNKFMIKEFQCV